MGEPAALPLLGTLGSVRHVLNEVTMGLRPTKSEEDA